ncbi:MAG: PEP/pyruvate-binding domain-containing protein, partial [Candidatus Omnitrophota bacterium]
PQDVKDVYRQYVEAYQSGVQQKIIAEYDESLKKYIPRKYFSGGVVLDPSTKVLTDPKEISSLGLDNLKRPLVEYTILQNPILDSKSGALSSPIIQDEFLSAENMKNIFDNEFAAEDFMNKIPKENRAWHMENLKNWIIENAQQHLSGKYAHGIRWDVFMDELLPVFEFSDEQVSQIITRLGIEEKMLDMPFDSTRPKEWQWIESLKKAIWPYGQVIAKNLIVYLRLQNKEAAKEDFSEIFQNGQIFKNNIIQSFSEIKESDKLFPFFRQITKDTFFLASSKTERIDQLMRIAEKEVNVSTHKGQDLLNLSDLKKVLENNHQRRRTGPNATYDPAVTAALEELKVLAESLTDKSAGIFDDIKGIVDECCDARIQAEFDNVQAMFKEGKMIEVISLLTEIRSQIYPLIIENIKAADRINHQTEKRYGPHIAQSSQKAQEAYKLMEADILIEQRIVDFSTEAFSLIRDNIISNPPNVKNIQDMISAIYIIAKNMTNALGVKPGLDILAENLIKMKDKQQYTKMDYYKIYGMVQQIQLELDDISAYLAKEFKPQVEVLQKKEGVVDYQDTPESLGFAQDLLRTTMLGQFNERFLLDCRKTIDQLEGPEELTLQADSFAQQRAREIMDIPIEFDSLARVINPDQTTENQMKRIGSKVYGLYVMKKLGLPIPDFFLMRSATDEDSFKIDPIKVELQKQIAALEKKSGKKIGDPSNPLLFSLRSVFPISMPGEFSTVLNAGMNDEIFEGLKKIYGEEFALFTYIRFLQDWAVLFSANFTKAELKFIETNQEISKGQVESLEVWLAKIRDLFSKKNIKIPEDPFAQIEIIADRIMNHSKTKEIQEYLGLHGVPDSWKPSVIFQEMDFGYLEEGSYTAVVYTRDTNTGENKLDIEAMYGATGVDLVGLNRSAKEVLSELPPADQELVE